AMGREAAPGFQLRSKDCRAAARPIATQGRSYKSQCWLEEISKTVAATSTASVSSHVQSLWELACRRKGQHRQLHPTQ
ncbi:hypothetical protein, partial [Pseudomonas inefficax]|uniref:hypothetical protein n=1 Tax=Pseudomonas inefficax TaxID=2078786 RepID=UPI002DB9EA6F